MAASQSCYRSSLYPITLIYIKSPQSIFSDLRLYQITSCYFWPDLSWIKKNGVYTIIMIQHQILLGLTNDCHFIGWQEAHRPSHALCETLYSLKSRSTPNYSPTIANISSPSPWTQKLTFGSLGMYRLYFDHVHTCENSGVIKDFW